MTSPHPNSPMTSWLVALVIVLPIPLTLLVPLTLVQPAGIEGADEIHYRAELIDYLDAERRIGGPATGVMLAMSGGSCATVGPRRLSDNGVDLYVAYYYGATIETFAGLVDVLLDGSPDFIVIQDTVLVMKPSPYRARALYYKARNHWYGQFYGLAAKLDLLAAAKEENDDWRCGAGFVPREAWLDIVESASNSIVDVTEQKRVRIVQFLRNFDTAGIPVIVAGPPENHYTAGYRREVFKIVEDIVTSNSAFSNISLHRQSELTSADNFYDPLHVARDANEPYRQWLNNEIIDVLRMRENQ